MNLNTTLIAVKLAGFLKIIFLHSIYLHLIYFLNTWSIRGGNIERGEKG